jgi:hypothetical protein
VSIVINIFRCFHGLQNRETHLKNYEIGKEEEKSGNSIRAAQFANPTDVLKSHFDNTNVLKKNNKKFLTIKDLHIEEIGLIKDIIQERVGNNADIIMIVTEDKKIGKSLSITNMMSEFDVPEYKS